MLKPWHGCFEIRVLYELCNAIWVDLEKILKDKASAAARFAEDKKQELEKQDGTAQPHQTHRDAKGKVPGLAQQKALHSSKLQCVAVYISV